VVSWYQWRENTLILHCRITPRARRDEIGPARAGRLGIKLKAPPVEGRANAALIALLARHFAVSGAAVEIRRGAAGRDKTIAIHHPRQHPEWFQRMAASA
jgi:uncharacterized protein (TIGR00251 family)